MNEDARQTVGVAGVVRAADGRVLLIRTESAGWELPGGRVEIGEDLHAALRREIREETGCDTAPDSLAALCSHLDSTLLIATFRCRYLTGTPVPGDGSLAADWYSPDQARALITHPSERLRLISGLSIEPGVDYRVYRRTGAPGETFGASLVGEYRC